MGIPTLPDNLKKVLFVLGLVLMGAAISHYITSDVSWNQKRVEMDHKILEIKYDIMADSLEYQILQSQIDTLAAKKLSTFAKKSELSRKKLTIQRKGSELTYLKQEYNELFDSLKTALDLFIAPWVIGGILLLIGALQWLTHEGFNDTYQRKKIEKEIKTCPCQSCGMMLKNDLHPHVENELCSFCFDGKKYTEPEITLAEMSDRIRKRMKMQGSKQKLVEKHIKNLKALDRWTDQLRWK
ncbi:MAG: zinc ribbon domain-containing protein [Bacteroidia bacterium]